MDKVETAKILSYITGAYPFIFSKFTEKEREQMIMAWQRSFKNDDVHTVFNAVEKWCNTEKNVPTFVDIKDNIFELKGVKQIDVGTAWNVVYDNLSSNSYVAKENFNKLPTNIKETLGTSKFLVELGNASNEQVGLLRKEFEKKYIAILKKERNKLYNGEISYFQLESNNYSLLENQTKYKLENK